MSDPLPPPLPVTGVLASFQPRSRVRTGIDLQEFNQALREAESLPVDDIARVLLHRLLGEEEPQEIEALQLMIGTLPPLSVHLAGQVASVLDNETSSYTRIQVELEHRRVTLTEAIGTGIPGAALIAASLFPVLRHAALVHDWLQVLEEKTPSNPIPPKDTSLTRRLLTDLGCRVCENGKVLTPGRNAEMLETSDFLQHRERSREKRLREQIKDTLPPVPEQ